jgi:hypothetical protein
MEKLPTEGLSDVGTYYQDLSPLDRSREVYLFTSFITEEISSAQRWNEYNEAARRDYARCVGDQINTAIPVSSSSEEIGDLIVHHINSETQQRWVAYTALIDSASKGQVFVDLLASDTNITCDSEEKAKQTHESWERYLKEYGLADAEFNADVRAEFVRNKIIWDTAKEALFLHAVLTADQDKAAA